MAEQKNRTDDERELLRALVSGPAVGVPQHADAETRKTFTDRRMEQREAYGQWIANAPIYVPGTGILAFNTGMAVPVEHVKKWDLELAGLVERVASPQLARAGRRFSANEGGQLPGGHEEVVVPPEPTTSPPAPADMDPADDEGGASESKPRKSTSAKAKTEGNN